MDLEALLLLAAYILKKSKIRKLKMWETSRN